MTHLPIILPAYHEASDIQAGKLAQVAGWLAEQAYEAELIVVDDGSADEMARLARSARPDQHSQRQGAGATSPPPRR